METIIGLLVFLLPVVFKLIGGTLEKAGKQQTADRMKKVAELFDLEEAEIAPEPSQEPVQDPVQMPRPEPPGPKPSRPEPPVRPQAVSGVLHPAKTAAPVEEKPVRREKIDSKKLVVYSELMRPKYLE